MPSPIPATITTTTATTSRSASPLQRQVQDPVETRYCSQDHPLVRDFPPAFCCDICNRSYKAGSESHACRGCFFDACARCFYAPTCRGRHLLREGVVALNFNCDICTRLFPAGTKAFSCRADNFDVCTSCYEEATSGRLQQRRQVQQQYASKPASPSMSNRGFIPSGGVQNQNSTTAIHPPPPEPQQQQLEVPLSPPKGSKCRSLFVGINYYRSKAELKGSINDIFTSMKLLRALGYDLAMTKVLVDDRNFIARTGTPDKKSIEGALAWLVEGARPGDHLFLHFAGHAASQLHDVNRVHNNNSSGGSGAPVFVEALVPADYLRTGLITDEYLYDNFFTRVPQGCRLTCVFDTATHPSAFGADLQFEWRYDDDLKKFKQSRRSATRSEAELQSKLGKFSRAGGVGDILVLSSSSRRDDSVSGLLSPEGSDVGELNVQHFERGAGSPGIDVSGGLGQSLTAAIAPKVGVDGKPHLSLQTLTNGMQNGLRLQKFTDRVLNISSTKKIDFEGGFSLFGQLPSVR